MNKKISQGKKLRQAIAENVPLQIVGTVNAYSSLLAEKKGLRVTFMPKPFLGKTGNGCHAHVSIWNKSRKNIFLNKKFQI